MKTKIWLMMMVIGCFALSMSAERFTIETGQFEKIKVTTNINVVYHCVSDSTGFAWYDAEAGMDDVFFLSVKKDGGLKIQVTDAYWGKTLPVLHVYSDFLSSVENSSDLSLTLINPAPCASFSANQIGNGSITAENLKCNNVSAAITTGNGSVNLSGKCVNANFQMVGAGLISADRLQAENVKCTILGTGSIGCWPVDNLTVKGLGTTKIYYKGSPNIKKTGGGKLFELPEDDDDDYYETGAIPVKVDSFNERFSADDEDDDELDDEEDDEEDDDEEEEIDEETQTIVTADE